MDRIINRILSIDRLETGNHLKLGAHLVNDGINFAVFSENATQIQLCIFDEAGNKELARLSLPEFTDGIWHGYLPQANAGLVYGYRAFGPNTAHEGHRFNPYKLLIDPYARQLVGNFIWSPAQLGFNDDGTLNKQNNARDTLKAVVTQDTFDWENDRPLRIPLEKSILYEVHVKGFTKLHPEVPEELRGTYEGFASEAAIKHLKRLGITAVSLLPVHYSISEQQLVNKGLSNYWGYNTLAFFAPDKRFARQDPIHEFKSMVKQLHAAGIEVILDVVYNHTAEGNHLGPTLSFKGLDNKAYYHLQAGNLTQYENYTGTGNALNLHHPRVLQLVMDSLRYWVAEMHVDGFRFDLAPTLARSPRGFETDSSFFACLRQDPILSQVKLIAEPWDIGSYGYQVGNFPGGWSEWNDKYRDTIRTFWTKGKGHRRELVNRLSASPDIFGHHGRRPQSSVNFITAHDGFTLHDLVSYNRKHNEINGEDNRDGASENYSWNCGVEGESNLLAINFLRTRLKRSLLATLLLSQGVPMLLGGDELGRTQNGNNNAYNQDNDINWFQWEDADDYLISFVSELIQLRLRCQQFSNIHWLSESSISGMLPDVVWLNSNAQAMNAEQLQETDRHLFAMLLNSSTNSTIMVAINAEASDRLFHLPEGNWKLILETAKYPEKIEIIAKGILTLKSRSLVVLES